MSDEPDDDSSDRPPPPRPDTLDLSDAERYRRAVRLIDAIYDDLCDEAMEDDDEPISPAAMRLHAWVHRKLDEMARGSNN